MHLLKLFLQNRSKHVSLYCHYAVFAFPQLASIAGTDIYLIYLLKCISKTHVILLTNNHDTVKCQCEGRFCLGISI